MLTGFLCSYIDILPIDNTRMPFWNLVDVPKTYEDLRKKFLCNKSSLRNTLPRPETCVVNDHVYTSLIDVVADFLGHNNEISDISNLKDVCFSGNVCNIDESAAAKVLYENLVDESDPLGTFYMWLIEWSDDFDPNSSSKNNRASVCIQQLQLVYGKEIRD